MREPLIEHTYHVKSVPAVQGRELSIGFRTQAQRLGLRTALDRLALKQCNYKLFRETYVKNNRSQQLLVQWRMWSMNQMIVVQALLALFPPSVLDYFMYFT